EAHGPSNRSQNWPSFKNGEATNVGIRVQEAGAEGQGERPERFGIPQRLRKGVAPMNRGQGRVFQRGSYLWIGYYVHGKEQREVAKHVRRGEKIEPTERGRHEAQRFLKYRLGEIAAEQHGGRSFIGPQQERVTVNQLLDGLENDYKLRDCWNVKTASV